MVARTQLVSLAFAASLLLSLELTAQDDFMLEEAPEEEEKVIELYATEVEFGIGVNTENSFKFGEFTGLEDDGPFFIGNIEAHGRAPFESDEAYYFEAIGRNLGLESRFARVEFGNQGDYAVFAEYDAIPRFQFDDAVTPYLGVGSENLVLPAGWVPATSTKGLTQLGPNLRQIDIETERERVGGGVSKHFGERWKFSTEFHHETKDGLDTIGSTFATNGGNTLGAILPETIDQETNRLEAAFEYVGEQTQAKLAYEFSLFNNETSRLRFQNAFSNPGGFAPWAAGAGFPTGVGEFAPPPDNHAHTVTFSGGHNLFRTTRVMLNASWSRFRQDEDLLPFSANPLLAVNTPLPRNSADAEVNNYLVNLRLASRPLPKTEVRASYRYHNRDNDTPQDVFVRIVGDAQDQPAGIANGNARINLPHSIEQHKADFEAKYRILRRTKVSANYTYERLDRDFQEVDYTDEHTVGGKVKTSLSPTLNGRVEYSRSFRDNSTYRGNKPFLESHTDAYLATLGPDPFENDPRLRKFMLAERDRDAVRGLVSYTPTPRLGLTLDANYTNDDFDESTLGLQERETLAATADASYSPNDKLSSHVFFTYENLRYDQRGCDFEGFGPSLADCIGSPPGVNHEWTAETEDDVYTTGLGLDWQVDKQLSLGFQYLFSRAKTSIEVDGQSALLPLPDLPDIDSDRHRVNLTADYKPRERFTVRFAYLYEMLRTDDFARDNVGPSTIDEVITLGQGSPDYDAHVFGVSLNYRF